MFTKDSTGHDWISATAAERDAYVKNAYLGCLSVGLGESFPSLVLNGLDAFFAIPSLRRFKISFAFGQIHTAQTKLGSYHSLIDSFRVGEQESGNL